MRLRAARLAIVFASITLTACNQVRPEDRLCRARQEDTVKPQGEAFADGYFPAAFGRYTDRCADPTRPSPTVSGFESEWYPRQWRAACEPSFYQLSLREAPPEFALRFSYMPSFDPSVFITVQSEGDGFRLIVKEMSGLGGYDEGTIARSREVRLKASQVAVLKKLLDEGALFRESPANCVSGFDGSRWIFELVTSGEYQMVNRWSPSEGAAHDLGEMLIRLSGLSVETY
jgi:hypothetical protein